MMLKITDVVGVEVYIYSNGPDPVLLGSDDTPVSTEN